MTINTQSKLGASPENHATQKVRVGEDSTLRHLDPESKGLPSQVHHLSFYLFTGPKYLSSQASVSLMNSLRGMKWSVSYSF